MCIRGTTNRGCCAIGEDTTAHSSGTSFNEEQDRMSKSGTNSNAANSDAATSAAMSKQCNKLDMAVPAMATCGTSSTTGTTGEPSECGVTVCDDTVDAPAAVGGSDAPERPEQEDARARISITRSSPWSSSWSSPPKHAKSASVCISMPNSMDTRLQGALRCGGAAGGVRGTSSSSAVAVGMEIGNGGAITAEISTGGTGAGSASGVGTEAATGTDTGSARTSTTSTACTSTAWLCGTNAGKGVSRRVSANTRARSSTGDAHGAVSANGNGATCSHAHAYVPYGHCMALAYSAAMGAGANASPGQKPGTFHEGDPRACAGKPSAAAGFNRKVSHGSEFNTVGQYEENAAPQAMGRRADTDASMVDRQDSDARPSLSDPLMY